VSGHASFSVRSLALSEHCLGIEINHRMAFAGNTGRALIIPAYWQAAWNASFNVTQLFGSLAASFVQDSFGRRAGFLMAIVLMTAGMAIAYTSSTSSNSLERRWLRHLVLG
jgi:MFS family permease